MAIDSSSASSTSSALQGAGLDQAAFLKLMMTQMTAQDPFKPTDNQQFLAQMAQFSTLVQTQQLNENIMHLLSIESSTQSIGLLGKQVNVTTSTGEITGRVSALSFNGGEANLTVTTGGGQIVTGISLSQVTQVVM
jgi:flagellar basal-body rod modification protein FlgD